MSPKHSCGLVPAEDSVRRIAGATVRGADGFGLTRWQKRALALTAGPLSRDPGERGSGWLRNGGWGLSLVASLSGGERLAGCGGEASDAAGRALPQNHAGSVRSEALGGQDLAGLYTDYLERSGDRERIHAWVKATAQLPDEHGEERPI